MEEGGAWASRYPDARNPYEFNIEHFDEVSRRAHSGRVLIRYDDVDWVQTSQSYAKFYVHPAIEDTAMHTMQVFLHEIREHSGMHTHQGGNVVIFVLRGRGYTLCDGQRFDWEAGDLILLPIKPGGVAHQHFNLDPQEPALWVALIVNSFRYHLANEMRTMVASPDWAERG